MAVIQRVIPQEELNAGFNLLKDIVAITKNPELIDAAHKRALDSAALTKEEQDKLVIARSLIADGDRLASELKKREDAIVETETAFGNSKKEFDQRVTSENLRLTNLEGSLNSGLTTLSDDKKKFEADKLALENEKKNLQQQHVDAMAKVDEKMAEAARIKKDNEVEARKYDEQKTAQQRRDEELVRLVTGK